MKSATITVAVGVLSGVWAAIQAGAGTTKTTHPVEEPRLVFHEVRYDARLGPAGARFIADLDVEELGRGVAQTGLFAGDVAMVPPIKLPTGFRIIRVGDEYRLVCERPGRARFRLEFVARVESVDRTNHVQFIGPCSAITAITAEAPGTDVELELLSGTVLDLVRTGSVTRLTGYLGADRTVALRWVPTAPAVQRRAVVAVETEAATLAMPTVIRHSVAYRYEILQGKLTRLSLELPGAQTLTRVVGDGIRDWQVREQAGQQMLTVELVRPIDGTYRLAVVTEQVPGTTPAVAELSVPRPVDAERETGSWTVSLEDVRAEVESTTGLRRVNAPDGVFVAFRFSERPVAMGLKLSRIEPEIAVTDRVSVRVEEARLAVTHELELRVEKAGVFQLEFEPDRELTVSDVRGEGVEDWSVSEGRLRVNFAGRVLGSRRLEVTMERALKELPPRIVVQPLAVAGARTEAVRIGVASAPGLSLKTHELVGLREVPVGQLPGRAGELLGYVGEQGAWQLVLEAERLVPRVIADVFNLVTIGDGLVGGSAVIRYGIFNQGVQQFRVRVPAHFKNVEFTGPNIRRKEYRDGIWTITLQDKV